MARKYSVTYISGVMGFGWVHDYDRIDEFQNFVDEIRNEYSACLTVWDNELECFIFWKYCLSTKCEFDILHAFDRNFRATTRNAL